MMVRTRFAPSPTGYMHIGGMRTALFNWLYARRHGGQFILRIDDTDQQRNIQEAIDPILDAFRWLNLNWDEGPDVGGENGPYYQSQRGELYQAAADRLLAAGLAYRDFDTPEQIQADRDEAQAAGRQYVNIRRSLDLSAQDAADRIARGDRWVLRFLVDRTQTIELDDEIRGHVQWDAGLMSDPVIMRPDGSPLYNFATVVDDAGMRISHVIRAEEHLSNTPVQILIHQALGNAIPRFAHIPFVMAPGTKKKISKREVDKYRKSPHFKVLFDVSDRVLARLGLDDQVLNPVMVEFYKQTGFVQAGLLNALGRLGWSLDETTENMSLDFLTENFSLERVVKAAAAFDPDKLMSYQAHWMNELPLADRVTGCLRDLQRAGVIGADPTDSDRQRVEAVVGALGDRIKLFSDILTYEYFFQDEIEFSPKDFQKRIQKDGVPELLADFKAVLSTVDDWSATRLETELQQFTDNRGVGAGVLIHALRIAATGSPIGPGVYDCLVLVGRDLVLKRIDLALQKAAAE